ncbi:hypothetical protein [Tamlana flava]|uniref:hypothetical protein n=1 Tax=Tamlana flava TaxID=3158572 RepID=UPI00351B050D
MKLPIIKGSYLLNISILIVSLYISWVTLAIGIAHLIGGENTDTTSAEAFNFQHILGVIFIIFLCLIGLAFLIIALAAIRGIIHKLKEKH